MASPCLKLPASGALARAPAHASPRRSAPRRCAGPVLASQQSNQQPAAPRAALTIASRRGVLSAGIASVFGFASLPLTPGAALALYDNGAPITDALDALSGAIASRVALQDLLDNIIDFSTTCPAPTFPCDLSVLTKKATKRLSGPLKQCLNTLCKEYGCDPYLAEQILQDVATAEAILYSNNARVKPQDFLNVADRGLEELFQDIPEDILAAAQARVDGCDLSVPPEAEGTLECRLVRAVAAGSTPK